MSKVKLETYTAKVDCQNCGESVELEIPKGTLIESHAEATDCPRCGCKLRQGRFKYRGDWDYTTGTTIGTTMY